MWYYHMEDGRKIDSERCCCFRSFSPDCPVHGEGEDPPMVPGCPGNVEEDVCPYCDGRGNILEDWPCMCTPDEGEDCPHCGGSGVFSEEKKCPHCGGGRYVSD